jgi:hypothetical protein
MIERFTRPTAACYDPSMQVVLKGTFGDAQPHRHGLVVLSSESKNLNGHDLIFESFHSVHSVPEFKLQIEPTKAKTGNSASRLAKTPTLKSRIFGFGNSSLDRYCDNVSVPTPLNERLCVFMSLREPPFPWLAYFWLDHFVFATSSFLNLIKATEKSGFVTKKMVSHEGTKGFTI